MTIDLTPPEEVLRARAGRVRPRTGPAPILVIDDELGGAAATTSLLARGGYTTTTEADGDAVLRLVRSDMTHLVVSELYIPCAEGRCVIAALKQDRTRLPRLQVLAYSRHRTSEDDAWALAAGCDALLHKPAIESALVREIQRLEGSDATEPQSTPGSRRSGS